MRRHFVTVLAHDERWPPVWTTEDQIAAGGGLTSSTDHRSAAAVCPMWPKPLAAWPTTLPIRIRRRAETDGRGWQRQTR